MGIPLSILRMIFASTDEAAEQLGCCIAWLGESWLCNEGLMNIISTVVTTGLMSVPIMLVVPRLWGQCVAASREAHRILRHTLEYGVRLRLLLAPMDNHLPQPQPQPLPDLPPYNLPCDDVHPYTWMMVDSPVPMLCARDVLLLSSGVPSSAGVPMAVSTMLPQLTKVIWRTQSRICPKPSLQTFYTCQCEGENATVMKSQCSEAMVI